MASHPLQRLSVMVGPLFTKELLVTSRRGKYYMLRFAYAAVLGLLVSLVWLANIESYRGTGASSIAQMSEMGKNVISFTMCFQFGVAQFVAIFLLSSAVNEEIYQRTLVPILTTPISYWQIILGKFLGKLLHVAILLAISLPLLGVIRVLGGVPWDYLLAGVCITITASMFTGSVGILFSVINRRTYLAIFSALGVVVGVYVVLGVLLLLISGIVQAIFGSGGFSVVLYGNPIGAMVYETMHLLNPATVVSGFYWPVHCVLMLGMAFSVLCLAQDIAHRTALRKAVGVQTARLDHTMVVGPGGTLVPVLTPVAAESPHAGPRTRKRKLFKGRGWNIKRLIGTSPIVWRELRKPLLRDKIVQIVAMCAVAFYLLYTYAILGASGAMASPDTQAFFVCMFLLAGMLCTAMDSATCIAPEKKARTWPALLCTPVSDWHILIGKAGGTVFRCLSVWIFLAVHVLLFTLTGHLHITAVLHVGMVALASAMFLTCAGVYFSAKYRNVVTALLLNLGLAGLLWMLIPIGAQQVGMIFDDTEAAGIAWEANPAVQVGTVVAGATRGVDWNRSADGSLLYRWPYRSCDWGKTTSMVFLYSLLYVLGGLLLAWRAKKMLRRNVFER